MQNVEAELAAEREMRREAERRKRESLAAEHYVKNVSSAACG